MQNFLAEAQARSPLGRGNSLPGVRGARWAAKHAVTGRLSCGQGGEADARLNSLWHGDSAIRAGAAASAR